MIWHIFTCRLSLNVQFSICQIFVICHKVFSFYLVAGIARHWLKIQANCCLNKPKKKKMEQNMSPLNSLAQNVIKSLDTSLKLDRRAICSLGVLWNAGNMLWLLYKLGGLSLNLSVKFGMSLCFLVQTILYSFDLIWKTFITIFGVGWAIEWMIQRRAIIFMKISDNLWGC